MNPKSSTIFMKIDFILSPKSFFFFMISYKKRTHS